MFGELSRRARMDIRPRISLGDSAVAVVYRDVQQIKADLKEIKLALAGR